MPLRERSTKGWVQVSAWLLFLVGILDLLFVRRLLSLSLRSTGPLTLSPLQGLALGSRLKVLRSLSQDSTTPSALRKLRLQREAERAPHNEHHQGGGDWQEFDREHPANVAAPPRPERPQRRSILQTVFRRTPPDADAGADAPADCAHEPPAPRSKSRNGPNGIVIGAPRPMASKKGVEVSIVVPPPTYQYGRE